MKPAFLCLLAVTTAIPTAGRSGGFDDDFSDPALKSRQALRGEWKFEDNQASCVADPKLYKEFKNHGPILRWPCELNAGTIEFEFQPKKVQRLVVTLNKDGHVFRIAVADEARTRIFGWSGPSKDNKPETIAKEGVPLISDLEGQWVKAKIAIAGDKGAVTLGDYSANLQHACFARQKGEVTISFAFGELAVRNVHVTSAEKGSAGVRTAR